MDEKTELTQQEQTGKSKWQETHSEEVLPANIRCPDDYNFEIGM